MFQPTKLVSQDSAITRRKFFHSLAVATLPCLMTTLSTESGEVQERHEEKNARTNQKPLTKEGLAFIKKSFPFFTVSGTEQAKSLGRQGEMSLEKMLEKTAKGSAVVILAGEMCPHLARSLPIFQQFALHSPKTLFVLVHGCTSFTAQHYTQANREELRQMVSFADPEIKVSQLALGKAHSHEHKHTAEEGDHGPTLYSSTFFIITKEEQGFNLVTPSSLRSSVGGGAWVISKESLSVAAGALGVNDHSWIPDKSPFNAVRGCPIAECSHLKRGGK